MISLLKPETETTVVGGVGVATRTVGSGRRLVLPVSSEPIRRAGDNRYLSIADTIVQ